MQGRILHEALKFQRLSFSEFHLYSLSFSKMETKVQPWTRWWFHIFLKVHPYICIYGNVPIWLIFFRWVGSTTNYVDPMSEYYCLWQIVSWFLLEKKIQNPSESISFLLCPFDSSNFRSRLSPLKKRSLKLKKNNTEKKSSTSEEEPMVLRLWWSSMHSTLQWFRFSPLAHCWCLGWGRFFIILDP